MDDLDKNQEKISTQITTLLNNLSSFTKSDFSYDFVNNKDFYKDM
ncbi:MAG: hypothetical protein P1U46_01730 [Patescibacteria group bacterium]|nr:hypothetical protein [Patescibacteria group bacterium]